jgi:hypothetical protein
MTQKWILGTLILCLCLMGIGCGDQSLRGNQAVPIVNLTTPVKSESPLTNQSLEIRNCDGNTEIHRSLADEAQMDFKVTLAEQGALLTNGKPIELSTDTKAQLVDQIKLAYQQIYAEKQASVEQTDLTVPVGRIRTFTIYWEQQVFNSTVSFQTDDLETFTTMYTYTLDIPSVTLAREMACTA